MVSTTSCSATARPAIPGSRQSATAPLQAGYPVPQQLERRYLVRGDQQGHPCRLASVGGFQYILCRAHHGGAARIDAALNSAAGPSRPAPSAPTSQPKSGISDLGHLWCWTRESSYCVRRAPRATTPACPAPWPVTMTGCSPQGHHGPDAVPLLGAISCVSAFQTHRLSQAANLCLRTQAGFEIPLTTVRSYASARPTFCKLVVAPATR
jgi:hypothetical protein